jgi:hypothetical protein
MRILVIAVLPFITFIGTLLKTLGATLEALFMQMPFEI